MSKNKHLTSLYLPFLQLYDHLSWIYVMLNILQGWLTDAG